MSPPDEVRVGLVGCGRLAERGYVPALRAAEGVRLAAVADPIRERCARAAPRVPAFANADELIAAGGVDALVLASPAASHLADAQATASAGLLTLIEKPPASSLAEAVELAGLDPAPRLSFNRRFIPAVAGLRAAVPAGDELALTLVLTTRRSSWRSYVASDDALLNLGPHLVDLARWLSVAEVTRVRGTVGELRARIELELSGGRGRAFLECAANRPYRERLVIAAGGRQVGAYAAGGLRAWLRLLTRGGAAEHPLVPSLTRQLEAFARAVRGEPEQTLADALDGVAVMATLEAARASAARAGAWEAVGAPVPAR